MNNLDTLILVDLSTRPGQIICPDQASYSLILMHEVDLIAKIGALAIVGPRDQVLDVKEYTNVYEEVSLYSCLKMEDLKQEPPE